jgi:adenylate kinase
MENKKGYKGILIFGAPGAGKGTQAKLLGEEKYYLHFSTGEMFRNLKNNSEIDKILADNIMNLISEGNLVPDDLTIKLFFQTLESYEKTGRYDPKTQVLILDGIPRNSNQVSLIKERIEVIGIIYLVIKDSNILVERLKKRAQIEGRADDSEEVILKRLKTYEKETLEILNKYPKDIILEIDGLPPIEEIHRDIQTRLKAKTI